MSVAAITLEDMVRQIDAENRHSQFADRREEPTPRRRAEKRKVKMGDAEVVCSAADGAPQVLHAQVVDLTEGGVGLEIADSLPVGAGVTVTSTLFSANGSNPQRLARVVHSQELEGGWFRVGLAFETGKNTQEHSAGAGSSSKERREQPAKNGDGLADYYEALQISPAADAEMIQRVYRMLAQRYHPDNTETGNEERFRFLLEAYKVLSDPERRAAYDVKFRAAQSLRWKIFERPEDAEGFEEDRHIRSGILNALYTARKRQPRRPSLSMKELEDLLGCPNESIEFAVWYLRGQSQITANDQSRFEITPVGVDAAEKLGQLPKRPGRLMIEEAHTA